MEGVKYFFICMYMNFCDFFLGYYFYVLVEGDIVLQYFIIKEDCEDIIFMIKDVMVVLEEGFKIIFLFWIVLFWMKDNNDWMGGKLQF